MGELPGTFCWVAWQTNSQDGWPAGQADRVAGKEAGWATHLQPAGLHPLHRLPPFLRPAEVIPGAPDREDGQAELREGAVPQLLRLAGAVQGVGQENAGQGEGGEVVRDLASHTRALGAQGARAAHREPPSRWHLGSSGSMEGFSWQQQRRQGPTRCVPLTIERPHNIHLSMPRHGSQRDGSSSRRAYGSWKAGGCQYAPGLVLPHTGCHRRARTSRVPRTLHRLTR
jgi:hypothetical protein